MENKPRLIIATDIIGGVETYNEVPKRLALIWEALIKVLSIPTDKPVEWVWIPGDSIWAAVPYENWNTDEPHCVETAILKACEITELVLQNLKKEGADKVYFTPPEIALF